jgi:Flp pilus assembly protein TadG
MWTALAGARRLLRRLWHRKDGSTAVEFALIVGPFLMLMMAIFETTIVYFASSTLEDAVDDAARQIRTGQVQVANMTAGQFRQLVCNGISTFLKCDASLVVDVRSFSQFQNVSFPSPLNPDGTLKNNQQFSPGGAGDVVLVRVFYTWQITTPMIGQTLSNMANNERLVEATTAFRNEPFGSILGN